MPGKIKKKQPNNNKKPKQAHKKYPSNLLRNKLAAWMGRIVILVAMNQADKLLKQKRGFCIMYLHARYKKDIKRHWKIPINSNIWYNFITCPFGFGCSFKRALSSLSGKTDCWVNTILAIIYCEWGPYPLLHLGPAETWESCTSIGIPLPCSLCRARSEHQKVAARTRLKRTERCRDQRGSSPRTQFYLTF